MVTESEKLLSVILDKNLNFMGHVNTMCKKAGQKLHALARIASYMNAEKLRIMMNTFVMSQFGYCSLIWMFHNRSVNKKINKIQERAMRIAYKDGISSFEELLRKADSVSMNQRNIKLFATDIFKTQSNLYPSFMKQIFVLTIFVVAEIFFAPQLKQQGMVLKVHVFLDLGYGMLRHLPYKSERGW